MKIYTKTGDDGTTMLFGGGRVKKSHKRIDAYGTVDELNCYVGLVRDHVSQEQQHERSLLKHIQNLLFTIGANLAANPDKNKVKKPDISETDVALLEQEMDKMNELLPALSNFVLPGGHPLVSYCHLARCVCRRSERLVVALSENEFVDTIIIRYLNRLSDYFFVLGRKFTQDLNAEEVIWQTR